MARVPRKAVQDVYEMTIGRATVTERGKRVDFPFFA